MFDDQPGGSGQDQPQGKLILRGYNNNAPASPQGDTVNFTPVQSPSSPEQMPTYYPPAQNAQAPYAPPTQQAPYGQQYLPQQAAHGGAGPRRSADPVFKFLIIAIVVVVLSGVVFAAFASGVANQIITQRGGNGQTTTNKPAPTSTQNIQGSGGQAALPTPTPTLMPTPTPTQQFPLQIVDINGQTPTNNTIQVSNNNSVQVNVHMSQPDQNVRVRLLVTYSTGQNIYKSNRRRVDNNGDVQLTWNVQVFNGGQNGDNVTANVVAASFDQNGQQIDLSAPVTVQINAGNNGGQNGNNNDNGNGQNGNNNGNGQN